MKNSKKQSSVSRIIVVRGAPGTGKSTISLKLSSLLPGTKKAYIPIDNIQHLDIRNASKDKFRLGIYHSAIICRSFIQEGFDVIIDYVFGSHSMKLAPCKVQIFYVDADFETIRKRNNGRQDPMPDLTLKELYEACNKTKGKFPGELVIDTTKLSPKSTAQKMLENKVAIIGCSQDGEFLLGEL